MTVEKVRLELKNIAKELNLALENPQVLVEWCKRGGWYNDEIFDALIGPLYFPKEQAGELYVNKNGELSIRKKDI